MTAFFNDSVLAIVRNDIDDAYEDLAYGGSYAAITGLFNKEAVTGAAKQVPLKYALGGGQSATAATAFANASLSARAAFVVTPFTCRGQSIIALDQASFSPGDDNSAADLLEDEVVSAMDSCKMQLDRALAGDGSGIDFTITAHSGTTPNYVLTLGSVTECNRVQLSAHYRTKDTNFGTIDTGSFEVVAVDPDAMTINVTAISSWTPTDTHVGGLEGTVATGTAFVTFPGIPAWIVPASLRASVLTTPFFTVDRSKFATKLAGLAMRQPGLGALEAINQMAYRLADMPGAEPDTGLMNFKTLGKIVAQLQTQKRYMTGSVQGPGISVFFKTVDIAGPMGTLSLIGSSHWDEDKIAVLTRKSWYVGSPDNKPFVADTASGNPVIDVPGTGTAGAFYRCSAIVWCRAPGHNGMIELA